jgi:hypothetical protein
LFDENAIEVNRIGAFFRFISTTSSSKLPAANNLRCESILILQTINLLQQGVEIMKNIASNHGKKSRDENDKKFSFFLLKTLNRKKNPHKS